MYFADRELPVIIFISPIALACRRWQYEEPSHFDQSHADYRPRDFTSRLQFWWNSHCSDIPISSPIRAIRSKSRRKASFRILGNRNFFGPFIRNRCAAPYIGDALQYGPYPRDDLRGLPHTQQFHTTARRQRKCRTDHQASISRFSQIYGF